MAQLTRPKCGPEVLAKRDSDCRGCPDPIVAKESYICVVDRVGAMHAECAVAYCRVLEEHQEDGDGE